MLQWLDECTGDDVWSLEHCRERGIPNSWIAELREIYESGFKEDNETLYYGGRRINQFEGILDATLADKIGQQFGINTKRLEEQAYSRSDFVRRVKEAIEEG